MKGNTEIKNGETWGGGVCNSSQKDDQFSLNCVDLSDMWNSNLVTRYASRTMRCDDIRCLTKCIP